MSKDFTTILGEFLIDVVGHSVIATAKEAARPDPILGQRTGANNMYQTQQPMQQQGGFGFVEFSRNIHMNEDRMSFSARDRLVEELKEYRKTIKGEDLYMGRGRDLSVSDQAALNLLKHAIDTIDSLGSRHEWVQLVIATGMMCLPTGNQEAMQITFVLKNGSQRSAMWTKQ